MNREVERILEEGMYPVKYTLSTPINVNNGVLNDDMLNRARQSFLSRTVGTWGEELVDTHQEYPENDISEVVFDIDVVLLKGEDFKLLKEYYERDEQLFSEGQEKS